MTGVVDPGATGRLYAIAPTQFGHDGSLDATATAENARRIAEHGIVNVLLTGAYGEFTALSDDERLAVLRAVVRTGACRRVMACAATTSTEATARLVRAMLDEGADTVMVSPPLATETSDADVLRHLDTLSRLAGGRLVIYNNPAFGHDLEPAVLGAAVAQGGYVAIKQGTRDVSRLLRGVEAVRAAAQPVAILAASDLGAVVTLHAGLDGLTSTNCWVFPDAFINLMAAWERGDGSTMQRLHEALAPYRAAVTELGQPATVKAAMQLRGFAGSVAVRGPYAAVAADAMDRLRAAVDAADARLAAVVASPQGVAS